MADGKYAGIALREAEAKDVLGVASDPVDEETRAQANRIVTDVREGGEAKLLEYAHRFGDIPEGVTEYVVGRKEMEAAFRGLPEEQQSLLERVAGRIRTFAQAQRDSLHSVSIPVPGGTAGHHVAPVARAGCYAPGGRYPLPSSVLMTAVTARVAGVGEVWVASPRPAAVTLAAGFVAGADRFLTVGGAQAIAALAYGVGQVGACDVIVGPGNRWVTAAKSLVAGRCGIDMLAGPSECLVIADAEASAELIAADLIAQAEHDVDAIPILLSTSRALADRVNAEIAEQLSASLPTAPTAAQAVAKGYFILCESLDAAISVSDAIAPEHLEIHTAHPQRVADRCSNFGGVFIGPNTAEVFGDYGVGPNHVLPTAGTGKYTGGLSVFTFLRIRTWLKATKPLAAGGGGGEGSGSAETPEDETTKSDPPHTAPTTTPTPPHPAPTASFEDVVHDTAALALLEGLWGHQRAALRRSKVPEAAIRASIALATEQMAAEGGE